MTTDTRPESGAAAPPPEVVLNQMLGGSTSVNLLYIAVELGIPDLLRSGALTSAEIATRTGANAAALHRVLRGLAVYGVLHRGADGSIALTPLGERLCTDVPGSMRPLVRVVGHPMIQRAWSELLHTAVTGEPALDRVVGGDGFAYMSEDPDLAARFNEMMSVFTAQVTGAVVAAYDFSGMHTLVDVGGGVGTLIRGILTANQHLHGTILDLPHAKTQAEAAVVGDGLAGRCDFVAGDFFAAVPAGADAYLLKSVLHDWDDERCAPILAACRAAMSPSSRLLIVEAILSEEAPTPDVVMGDLIMLAMGSGRERTEAEFRELLTRAGLHLTRIIRTQSGSSIVEAISA